MVFRCNAADYVENCINSIFNQSKQNIEIICVDDCSVDESFCSAFVMVKKDVVVCVGQGFFSHCNSCTDRIYYNQSYTEICVRCRYGKQYIGKYRRTAF